MQIPFFIREFESATSSTYAKVIINIGEMEKKEINTTLQFQNTY